MENTECPGSIKQQDSPEALPSLIKLISSNEVAGFISVKEHDSMTKQYQEQDSQFLVSSAHGSAAAAVESQNDESPASNFHQRKHSVSISMPASPIREHSYNSKTVLFSDHDQTISSDGFPDSSATLNAASTKKPKKAKFLSQPMPKGSAYLDAVNNGNFPLRLKNPTTKDKRFDSFKTWSGKLERQLSNLRGKSPRFQEDEAEDSVGQSAENTTLPVDRYFDALTGPELDTLKSSEQIVLPDDKKWPFLLRYPVSSFGICLGTGSQAILWKTLATASSTKFLHLSLTVNLVLWSIALALMALVSSIYLLKLILYFEAVRREYYHPVRVNFFFAPWIALLFLALGAPPSIADKLHTSLWYILMTPIFCLELKIYGQWMSGGQRRLSKVANPSNHLSVVGNFVGALLGASMGLKEGPIFFLAVGLAHYTVLFVTLYQRLPTNKTLPKELHPVFFLFVAVPSAASMAWAKIQGSFDYGSRIVYFVALFLYLSLAVRVNFFRGFKFSLAWWAYTFPMTGAAITTIRYSDEVTNVVTQALSVTLSSISTLTVTALFVTTILHAFVLGDLFPNDIAIAISERRPKTSRKWFHLRHGSSDTKDIENFLKFASSDSHDIDASPECPTLNTKQVQGLKPR